MKHSAIVFALLVLTAPLLATKPPGPTNRTSFQPIGPSDLARGQNKLAIDLLRQSPVEVGKNVFLGSWSIHQALAMTCAGADGQTADEMRKVLGLPTKVESPFVADVGGSLVVDRQGLHGRLAKLTGKILAKGKKKRPYHLILANRLWRNTGTEFRKEYTDFVKTHYGAPLEPVDFSDRARAAKTINKWVSKTTRKKIPKLLTRNDLAGQVELVLTNAIYFKAAWAHRFHESATRTMPFHLSVSEKVRPSDPTVRVEMMSQIERHPYYEDDLVQIVDLPYKGGDLSMTALLPKGRGDLAKLEKKLELPWLVKRLGAMKTRSVHVLLPKFETRFRQELSKPLKKLGMKRTFTSSADFSRMSEEARLLISKVVHEAYCKVDEKGTEAAAATAVVMETAQANRNPKRKRFVADHPFVFLIRHRQTGTILFIGRITKPLTAREDDSDESDTGAGKTGETSHARP
jgi:serpin B